MTQPMGMMEVNRQISREELVEVTTPICARGLVSIKLQTWLLSSVVNYLGSDFKQMAISKSSIYRDRVKIIEKQGNLIISYSINHYNEIKGISLCMHVCLSVCAYQRISPLPP